MSPRLTIDTSEAQGFAPVAPGPYHMTIDKIGDPFRSKNKQTLGVEITFAFADPEISQSSGTIRRFFPLEGKGAGFLADLIKVVTGNEIPVGSKDAGPIEFDTDELQGQTVMCEVANEEDENNPDRVYNRINKIVAA